MQKRIILLLDGTWNDIYFGRYDTNIVRLRELISKHLIRGSHSHTHHDDNDKQVRGYRASGREHIIYYERGVGTGAFDRFRGGALGEGLSRNIRHAYKFLSFWYEPGDEIFIYGFSRGAYTARSLVGYLGAAGLLRRDSCDEEMEALAWRYYRTATNDRLPAVWSRLTDYVHDRSQFRIKLLGVFDTVGALGVPVGGIAQRFNRDAYGFHDVELSSITDVNLHALAIDEHRWPFNATLWRQPSFKKYDTKVEQVWFSGAHSDVGGGYIVEEDRKADIAYEDDITLDWMIRRTKHYHSDFPLDTDRSAEEIARQKTAALHNSRRYVYHAWPFALRSIANSKTGASFWRYQAEVSRDRHAQPINEMIHISALKRLLADDSVGLAGQRYRAANLVKVMDWINNAYKPHTGESAADGTTTGAAKLAVVDWDGNRIENRSPRVDELRALLAKHTERPRSVYSLRGLFQALEGRRSPKLSARN